MEEEEDSGSVVSGKWIRKQGYVTEFDIDARWILYYPNDDRPHGSLRIVSHPDLPPGHLKSFVSIVTKRWPKTHEEINKTLETYGLTSNTELYFHNGVFYKDKVDTTYYVHNNAFYKNKEITKNGDKIIVKYIDPISQQQILSVSKTYKSDVFGDEFRITNYSNPITTRERSHLLQNAFSELESYSITEHMQTWDTETMDRMRNLEKLYNIKIFE